VIVLESGMGAERTAKALAWLVDPGRKHGLPSPRVIISAGFAGSLSLECAVGDVVAATEVCTLEGESWPTSWPPAQCEGVRQGRLVSATRLVSTANEKLDLARRSGAVAVDMESAVVARASAARGVAFGCVRGISDGATTCLSPALAAILSGPRVAPLRLVAVLARRPALALEMRRLAGDTRTAATRLALVLSQLFHTVSSRSPI
jgi:nucleoside phosphorylase